MKRIIVLVEGQTEEHFLKTVLNKKLSLNNIILIPTILKTKNVLNGPDYKGGRSSYGRVRSDLLKLFNDSNATYITTMFDYYALPNDFPGYKNIDTSKTTLEKTKFLEKEFAKDIDKRKFIPNLQLHEFESILFSSKDAILKIFPDKTKILQIESIIQSFSDKPEDINNSSTTAPSKRLCSIYPEYQKRLHGSLISAQIELNLIKTKCPHFASWIDKLLS